MLQNTKKLSGAYSCVLFVVHWFTFVILIFGRTDSQPQGLAFARKKTLLMSYKTDAWF